jgi:phosphohistidine swiveling domain-containing protein
MNSKKENWTFMWSSKVAMDVYYASSMTLKERPDLVPSASSFHFYDGEVITAYAPESLRAKFEKESKRYLDASFFARYRIKYLKERKNWWKWIRSIERKDYSEIPVSELINDQAQFTRYMCDSIAYFWTSRPEFTYATECELEQILRRYFPNSWPNIMSMLATSSILDDIQKEHLDFLKLVSARRNNREDSLKHLSTYPWLVVGQLDDTKALKFILRRFRKEKELYASESKRLKRSKRKLLGEQKLIFKKMKPRDQRRAKYLAYFLQTQSVERMNLKSYWAGSYWLARNMWKKTATMLRLPVDDVVELISPPEIGLLLKGTYKGSAKSIIRDRRKSFALDSENGKLRILNSHKAQKLFKERIKPATPTKTIMGQTASLGFYRGKVRKAIAGDLDMLQKSIRDFKKGEVLVTTMTQPNMMVIARKAGAIITDEGGITSHAAIISRELKVPCIVGCLHAMQVLSDGNLVEVDANRGVVKILERNRVKS